MASSAIPGFIDDSQQYKEPKKCKRKVGKTKVKTKEPKQKKSPPPQAIPRSIPTVVPSCKHNDKGFCCNILDIEDISDFQNRFMECGSKVKKDIFILRHCAVSAPKRCRSKDGIPRKSHIMHFYISKRDGSLVIVCRKTFTELLGSTKARVKGVITRYIESKKIPTEHRSRLTKKFMSVHNFIASLQGTHTHCTNCGAKKVALTLDQSIKKLWRYYNSKTTQDLKVVETYFRTIFMKHFNICFEDPGGKKREYCNRCANKDNETMRISENETRELKMLEMSYPPGEHFLFAPLPSNREPLRNTTWRDGDQLETSQQKNSEANEPKECVSNDSSLQKPNQNDKHQGTTFQDIVPQYRNNAECVKQDAEKSFTNYTPYNLTQMNDCGSFTNQMVIPSSDNYSRLKSTNQPFTCGNIFSSNMDRNSQIQTMQERNIIIRPESASHTSEHLAGDVIYRNSYQDPKESYTQPKFIDRNYQDHNDSYAQSKYLDISVNPNFGNDASTSKNSFDTSAIKENPNKLENKKKPLYKCVPCKLTFSNESTYNQHRNKHLNKKDLLCEVCNTQYYRRRLYKRHIKTHAVKKHKCSLCPIAFNHLVNLQIHIERQHPDTKC